MLQDQAQPLSEPNDEAFFITRYAKPETAEIQALVETMPSAIASKVGGHQPSRAQTDWARYFVLSGNSTAAAKYAGYASPGTMAIKNLCNPTCLDLVKRLMVINMQAHLPAMINRLVEIGLDPKTDPKAAVSAISTFMDRAGLKPKADGPSVNVQVNINGRDAQQAIAEVWSARNQRKGEPKAPDISLLSDIPDTMSDNLDGDDDLIIQGDLEAPKDTGGGSVLAGPVASSDALPPPIPPSSSSVSMVDD